MMCYQGMKKVTQEERDVYLLNREMMNGPFVPNHVGKIIRFYVVQVGYLIYRSVLRIK